MKFLLLPAALFLLAAPSGEQITLEYTPEEGMQLRRVFDAEAEYSLTDIVVSIEGEEIEHHAEMPEYSTSFQEHIAVTDTLVALADGRPTELLRTFDELSQENLDKTEEEESEAELGSPLQGLSVRFRWDEDDESYVAEPADDEQEIDSELLAVLAEDMDLRLVLPSSEVEIGDEWELDPRLYLAFMWPSGLLDFHAEGEETGADERAISLQTIERLEGTGTARLEDVREVDGVSLAVIHVEMEITTGSERVVPPSEGDGTEEEEGFERPEITVVVEIERSLEGIILWDLEHGHAHSAELECSASRLHTESWTITGQQNGEEISAEVEQARLFEGTIRYRSTIERL